MPKILLEKLSLLQEILRDLKPNISLSRTEQEKKRYEIERQVQLCVELSLSMARHVLARMGENVPDNGREVFIQLADKNFVSRNVGDKMALAVGLRNILVHEYAEVDRDTFYGGLPSGYSLFVKYVEEIQGVLEKLKN